MPPRKDGKIERKWGLGLTFDVFSQIMCSGPTFLIGWTKEFGLVYDRSVNRETFGGAKASYLDFPPFLSPSSGY
ncbi:hypothetical protein OUZ56_007386 [Daphnia magna]|uniref:Uncharacterized protein n=1 Tax=Daphnia magna TaxID=35525 RepID=A0ABR0A9U4_9CRUS|nr:hypothetical protein OUZ56_007386 [Daphnia magna]